MVDRCYFYIAPNTPAAAAVTRWVTSVTDQRSWVQAFLKRHDLEDASIVHVEYDTVGIAPGSASGEEHSPSQHEWDTWLGMHPQWRKIKPRGSAIAYAVPRKSVPGAKALYTDWAKRPRVKHPEALCKELTGLDRIRDLIHGRAIYSIGFRIRPDGQMWLRCPYFALKSTNWLPLIGLLRGDQDTLRDAWENANEEDSRDTH